MGPALVRARPALKKYPVDTKQLTKIGTPTQAFLAILSKNARDRILICAVPGGVELRLATAHPDGRISPKTHAFKLRDSLLRAAATALVQAADAADAEDPAVAS